MSALPNFIIIGAAKCGTTSLYHYLSQNNNVFLPADKEPHFFDKDYNYERGTEYYLRFFRGAESYAAVGEATPNYFHEGPRVATRIRKLKHADRIKFIVLLRDPVQRAWSHYLHMRRICQEKMDFWTAVCEDLDGKRDRSKWTCYFSDGLYASQLRPWLSTFERDQFQFFLLQDLIQNPELVLRSIEDGLDIPHYKGYSFQEVQNAAGRPVSRAVMEFLNRKSYMKDVLKPLIPQRYRKRVKEWIRKHNSIPFGSAKPKMTYRIEKELRQLYRDDVTRLEVIINRDLTHWKK